MKTIAVEKEQSFFSKLIDKFKNSAIADIVFSPTAGTAEEVDEQTQFETLAQNSGISEKEQLRILKNATNSVKSLAQEMDSYEKQEEKSELDKYKVVSPQAPKTKSKSKTVQTEKDKDLQL